MDPLMENLRGDSVRGVRGEAVHWWWWWWWCAGSTAVFDGGDGSGSDDRVKVDGKSSDMRERWWLEKII